MARVGAGAVPQKREVDWVKMQAPAGGLTQAADGTSHVGSGVRWSFNHAPEVADWTPNFTDATVPGHVKDAYLVIEPFQPYWAAAHGLLAFDFPSDTPVRNGRGEAEPALAASWEPRFLQGVSFNVLGNGFASMFPLHCQLETFRGAVDSAAGLGGHPLVRYKLNLSQEQKDQLLHNVLQDATHLDPDRKYQTLNSSCVTEVVHQVNRVLPHDRKLPEWWLPGVHDPGTALPTYVDVAFRDHGLIDDSGGVLIEPDRTRYPQAQVPQHGPIRDVVRRISDVPGFPLIVNAATTILGAAAGSVAGPAGSIAAGMGVAWMTRGLGDFIRRRSHTEFEPYEKYFPPTAGDPAP